MTPAREPDSGTVLPSDAEMRILRQLWIGGEQTVRDVHQQLRAEWPVGYTTVLKLLQRMLDKGFVDRTARGRTHWYRAALPQERTERQLVRHILDRVFGGSVGDLVQAALPRARASKRELQHIRQLIGKLERKS